MGTVTPASGIALRPGELNLGARRPPLDKTKDPAVASRLPDPPADHVHGPNSHRRSSACPRGWRPRWKSRNWAVPMARNTSPLGITACVLDSEASDRAPPARATPATATTQPTVHHSKRSRPGRAAKPLRGARRMASEGNRGGTRGHRGRFCPALFEEDGHAGVPARGRPPAAAGLRSLGRARAISRPLGHALASRSGSRAAPRCSGRG